jgi:hypothetical protein
VEPNRGRRILLFVCKVHGVSIGQFRQVPGEPPRLFAPGVTSRRVLDAPQPRDFDDSYVLWCAKGKHLLVVDPAQVSREVAAYRVGDGSVRKLLV